MDKEFGFGFNAETLTYGNMLEVGVLDSATVVENSLQNSVSIASLVLTTGVSEALGPQTRVGWAGGSVRIGDDVMMMTVRGSRQDRYSPCKGEQGGTAGGIRTPGRILT